MTLLFRSPLPIPAITRPVLIRFALFWSPNRRDGPARNAPIASTNPPNTKKITLLNRSGMRTNSKFERTTTAVKWKKKTPISCSLNPKSDDSLKGSRGSTVKKKLSEAMTVRTPNRMPYTLWNLTGVFNSLQ